MQDPSSFLILLPSFSVPAIAAYYDLPIDEATCHGYTSPYFYNCTPLPLSLSRSMICNLRLIADIARPITSHSTTGLENYTSLYISLTFHALATAPHASTATPHTAAVAPYTSTATPYPAATAPYALTATPYTVATAPYASTAMYCSDGLDCYREEWHEG